MKNANDTMKLAQERFDSAQKSAEKANKEASTAMDMLGKLELNILKSFGEFSQVLGQIQGRPTFDEVDVDGVKIPKFNAEELHNVSIGAGVLLGGLGGAALGTAGGFAAAGATSAAVLASTGTAIASLSGAAATNATLAALGGGAIAAGGGGIALGTTILGATTLGIGLLVGGVIFGLTGSSLSNKADQAWLQARDAENQSKKICEYLQTLKFTATEYHSAVNRMNNIYMSHLHQLSYVVNTMGKTQWSTYNDREKRLVENTVLLVGMLYKMCQVKLVLQAKRADEMNTVNEKEVSATISDSRRFLTERRLVAYA
jgi:hypothetical protein